MLNNTQEAFLGLDAKLKKSPLREQNTKPGGIEGILKLKQHPRRPKGSVKVGAGNY